MTAKPLLGRLGHYSAKGMGNGLPAPAPARNRRRGYLDYLDGVRWGLPPGAWARGRTRPIKYKAFAYYDRNPLAPLGICA